MPQPTSASTRAVSSASNGKHEGNNAYATDTYMVGGGMALNRGLATGKRFARGAVDSSENPPQPCGWRGKRLSGGERRLPGLGLVAARFILCDVEQFEQFVLARAQRVQTQFVLERQAQCLLQVGQTLAARL